MAELSEEELQDASNNMYRVGTQVHIFNTWHRNYKHELDTYRVGAICSFGGGELKFSITGKDR